MRKILTIIFALVLFVLAILIQLDLITWYQVPKRRIDGTICSIEAYKRTQYNVKSGRKTIQNDSNCRWR